jgi:hypothetical protein
MKSDVMLSKSTYCKGLRCHRALWLAIHRRELAAEPTPEQQARFDTGHSVGELAQGRYPGGVLIDEEYYRHADAQAHTQAALAAGAPAIYEAAFSHAGVRVRVDVLARLESGGYELIEVKSTTRYTAEKHLPDAAVQLHVLLGNNIDVRRVSLMHLNRDYVWAGGKYDLDALFTATDITQEAREFMARVPIDVAAMLAMLAAAEPPPIPESVNCAKPYECEFATWCLGEPEAPDLDAPVRFEQAPLSRLCGLAFPLHFVDFETVMPALPVFVGTSPYQTVKVQWSMHVLHEDGRLEHAEYLVSDTSVEPSAEFFTTLIDALGEHGTFVHYSTYERTQLVDIAVRLPELRQPLVDRIPGFHRPLLSALSRNGIADESLREPTAGGLADFDLGARVVKDGCFHPVFGSDNGWSIKPAIKILAKDLPPYSALAISGGEQAMNALEEMLDPETDSDRAAALRADLLAYCAQDTLAMVEIYRTLLAACE